MRKGTKILGIKKPVLIISTGFGFLQRGRDSMMQNIVIDYQQVTILKYVKNRCYLLISYSFYSNVRSANIEITG